MEMIGYFDGACGPVNPGGTATWGIVVYRDGKRIHEDAGVIGTGEGMTNNVAEAVAAEQLLRFLMNQSAPGDALLVRGDSNIMVRQLSGATRKTPKGHYASYIRSANVIACEMRMTRKVRFEWIPREQNYEADAMAGSIQMDAYGLDAELAERIDRD